MLDRGRRCGLCRRRAGDELSPRRALSGGARSVCQQGELRACRALPLQPGYSPLCSPPPLLAKGPVVHAHAALLALARDKGVRYLHESAVMDGVPIDLVVSTWLGCIFRSPYP